MNDSFHIYCPMRDFFLARLLQYVFIQRTYFFQYISLALAISMIRQFIVFV